MKFEHHWSLWPDTLAVLSALGFSLLIPSIVYNHPEEVTAAGDLRMLFFAAILYLTFRVAVPTPYDKRRGGFPSQNEKCAIVLLATFSIVMYHGIEPYTKTLSYLGFPAVIFSCYRLTFAFNRRPEVVEFDKKQKWWKKHQHIIEKLPIVAPPKFDVLDHINSLWPEHHPLTKPTLAAVEEWYDTYAPITQANARELFDRNENLDELLLRIHRTTNGEAADKTKATTIITIIRNLTNILPSPNLIKHPGKMTWGMYMTPLYIAEGERRETQPQNPYYASLKLLPSIILKRIQEITFDIFIPQELRNEHMHIIASSGHGKTQLLQSMILDDLMFHDCSLVVIDSQGDIIRNIARTKAVADERLVLLDAADVEYPLALNLFDMGRDRLKGYSQYDRERMENATIELYSFVMASLLGAELTSKQSTAFEYVVELLLHIEGANIHTLRKLFEPQGVSQYVSELRNLSETGRSFFRNEFDGKEFEATKKQILRRLYGILRNKTFERMFTHHRSKIDLFTAMNEGKVILINTAEPLLGEGCKTVGRFFIALLIQAIQERQIGSKRTYLYVDEADQYFDDKIIEILVRARKREFGLIAAHQFLGQLSPSLDKAFAANTSIKFAGGVSAEDATILSRRMNIAREQIMHCGKGRFAAWFKGYGTGEYSVDFGRMEATPQRSEREMERLRSHQRELYAVHISELNRAQSNDDVPDDGW